MKLRPILFEAAAPAVSVSTDPIGSIGGVTLPPTLLLLKSLVNAFVPEVAEKFAVNEPLPPLPETPPPPVGEEVELPPHPASASIERQPKAGTNKRSEVFKESNIAGSFQELNVSKMDQLPYSMLSRSEAE